MSVRYHVNPETGRANICRAEIKCDFSVDGIEPPHYKTKDEAKKGAEKNFEKEYDGTTKALKKNDSKAFKNKRQAAIRKAKKESVDPNVQRENELKDIEAKANELREEKKNYFTSQHHYSKEITALKDREIDTYANTLSKEKLYKLAHGYEEMNEKSRITRKDLTKEFFRKASSRKEYSEAMENYNQEKEVFYSNIQPMTAYQDAMSKVLVGEGEFYKPKEVMAGSSQFSSWGDTRGTSDFQAQNHFKECGVAGFNNFEENASWEIYDTFNSEDKVGIKAEMSCNCQKCFKSQVFIENNTGMMLNKLINAK